jgi:ornithine cyclodeaminase/alanine dehydrogenase-like protein (mu-crystallin family)
MLVLSRREVESVMDLDALVERVADAMVALSEGNAAMPSRTAVDVPKHDGFLGIMPAYLPGAHALATKLVAVWPHNRDRPSHQAVIVCFDPGTGTPQVLMDGTYITAARTAAGSALATKLLAREDSTTVAILGTGVQARAHAHALVRVRPVIEVVIAGRDPNKAEQLADELGSVLAVETRATTSWRDAVGAADIVCACTHSPEPVVNRNWLRPGAHVNSVGFNPAGRELDAETVAAARVVVESRSTLAPPPTGSNDLFIPMSEGRVPPDHVHAEIGELVKGSAEGRTSKDQITLYKSVGVAVQDAAAAALVIEAAAAAGAGTEVGLD